MAILFNTARMKYPDPNIIDAKRVSDGLDTLIRGALSTQTGFQSSFVEDGTKQVPGLSFAGSRISDTVAPNRRRTISQDVTPTILIKKRMFSTLRDYYDLDYLGSEDRLYIRAVKNLIRKKCEDIAYHESLTYIDKIIEDPGFLYESGINDTLIKLINSVETIASAISSLAAVFNPERILVGEEIKDRQWYQQIVDLKNAAERSRQNKLTTWIVDPQAADLRLTGPGVGVVEFTMVSQITTSTTLSGAGQCELTIEDPYKLSMFTEADLDQALKEAYLEDGRATNLQVADANQIISEVSRLDRELNTARRARGASEINFQFPYGVDGDVYGTLVRYNFSFANTAIFISTDGLQRSDSLFPFEERLIGTESTKVDQIFTLLNQYKAIQERFIVDVRTLNAEHNGIRDRMRQEFVGSNIIQHMDSVHVFINSATKKEDTFYDGQTPTQILSDIRSQDDMSARISRDLLDAEGKTIIPILGPTYQYLGIRDPYVFRGTGPQVWQGVVTDVRSSYNAQTGAFTINIGATDNTYFTSMSRVSQNPGLNQPDGPLEQPLTPYDLNPDPATGLINSNPPMLLKENLERINSGLLKYSDYPYLGATVKDEKDLHADTSEADQSAALANRHIDGLLYTWKKSILTITQNTSFTDRFGEGLSLQNTIRRDYGQPATTNPFAKLDAADVISVLVCGQPYNALNFLRMAIDAGNLSLPNGMGNNSYFAYLADAFQRTNPTNGFFIPAKSSIPDTSLAIQQINKETSILKNSTDNKRIATLQARLDDLNRDEFKDSDILRKEREYLQNEINTLKKSAAQVVEAVLPPFIFNNPAQTEVAAEELVEVNNSLRYSLLKKPEDVRYNKDKNFFVVSSKYDTDHTVQAFVSMMRDQSSFNPFTSTYKSPKEIIDEVTATLNFEFFADSQGNLNFRPPEYNRIPLSLLNKLIQMGTVDGIDIIPGFLKNIINNKSSQYRDELELVELQVRERAALLGAIPIADVGFISELDSEKSTFVLRDDLIAKEATISEGGVISLKADLESNEIKDIEDSVARIILIRNKKREFTGFPEDKLSADNESDKSQIEEEIRAINSSPAERLRVLNDLAVFLTQRKVLCVQTTKIAGQKKQLDGFGAPAAMAGSFLSSVIQSSLIPGAGTQQAQSIFPKIIDDFITNDYENYTGPNAGKRFVIEDDVIISTNWEIKPPDFCRIDVYGAENLIGEGESLSNANIKQFWAGATDFDMWRQFGFRATQSEVVPYLSNAETQLAPHAVFRLLQQRGQLHSGTIKVVGNEHYQVGETVYVTSKEMLYYITSVTHQVDLDANAFTTTLSLAYGRPLGQYIPHPYDLVGRTILGQNRLAGLDRKTIPSRPASASVRIIGTIDITPTSGQTLDPVEIIRKNSDMIVALSTVAAGILEKEKNAKLDIRSYKIGDITKVSNSPVKQLTQDELNTLMTQVYRELTTGAVLGAKVKQAQPSRFINATGTTVDIQKPLGPEDFKYRRIPSQSAWTSASTLDQVAFPINAIEVAVVISNNIRGDQLGEVKKGTHEIPDSVTKEMSSIAQTATIEVV